MGKFLGNRIRFLKEMKEGENFCTQPRQVIPTREYLGSFVARKMDERNHLAANLN